jgi:hypothetical protein
LEVVDGFLLGGIVGKLHEGETALAAGFTIKGKAALTDFAVLAEQIKQILTFSLEREIADVNSHENGLEQILELIRVLPGSEGLPVKSWLSRWSLYAVGILCTILWRLKGNGCGEA